MPPRRSRRATRARPAARGGGVACVVAALALVGVMGVVVHQRDGTPAARASRAPQPAPSIVTTVPPRAAAVKARPRHPLDVLRGAVRDVEQALPALKRTSRGSGFERTRIDLLARMSDARDELGAYLDRHPNDERANRLWDRVLRLHAALRKI